MALNMNNQRALMDEILPEVQIGMTSSGIMVTSARIAEPVIIPFDQTGKCPECKATELEVDYVVTKEGCRIWCTRLKKQPRFVPFDCVYDLPGHTFIKIRNKARVFNVPHGFPENDCRPAVRKVHAPPPMPTIPEEKPMGLSEIPLPHSKPQQLTDALNGADSGAQTNMVSQIPPPPPEEPAKEFMDSISAAITGMDFGTQTASHPEEPAKEFMDSISAATTGMDFGMQTEPQGPTAQAEPGVTSGISIDAMPREISQWVEQEQKDWEDVQEFMDSIAAATTGLNFASAGVQQMKTAEGMKDEKESIPPTI